ncbi:GH1 family beta-glucosidase [Arthrobacter zhangbolii]|uniref:Beta-glucosidase n=1 Tax=Arthrobacter zhangbolii TaxID=2886936 RepID=A0A9X1S8U6_9MICC|nr:GH1 family beta-glucosidase [Arthrobacter zhangbolii]MCC3271572.1 beta-glucosidase [Arthrobacter zhangbolii]MCC3293481.1 beta-glucosidase [Arthrobacter zhangbolii]UON90662.1 GH1 family beta-glucosidase [Arthrobacter zhangbolii]
MTNNTPEWNNFPAGFIWGSATAAAQVEGAAAEDGKEESVWDAFAAVPGNVRNGDTPAVAVDHYHRMPQDVALMKDLGLDSYRFSTSWARVRPGGRDLNRKGLDFYSRLVDELLEAGILPWLTLYHWDLPQALEEAGGWTNRDTAFRFVEYAQDVYSALGDRVAHWTTFNEPFCSSLLGYGSGAHAPGRQDPRAAIAAVHHQHLAHGMAVTELRGLGARELGITLNLSNSIPRDAADPVDVEAARLFDSLQNRIFLDPILRGAYPEDSLRDLEPYGLHELILPGDMETIGAPIDFLGVNHYHDDQISGHPDTSGSDGHGGGAGRPTASPWIGAEHITFPSRGLPRTGMDWEVNPGGLRTLLLRLGEEYPQLPPLYITENGAAYDDEVLEDGSVPDTERTRFILDHIRAVSEAISAGADVRGYFVWSLLDNFEWSWGYSKRFGIVRVDYETQERTVKDSGHAYRQLIAAGRSTAAAAPAV